MTTLAFVRSLVAWQEAMTCAVGGPQPFALYSLVDLVAAATSLATAREWEAFLGTIERANADIVTDGERQGASDYDLAKFRMIASFAGSARKHALEHVASFDVAIRRAGSARRRG